MRQTKVCKDCEVEKPTEQFYKLKISSDGFHIYCKPCHKVRRDKLRAEDKDGYWRRHLKWTYGLSVEDYNKMKVAQNNKCAICDEERKLFVDHCHTTGKVRGLLCQPCNNGIGGLKDNINLLQRAIEYLKEDTSG